MIDIFKKYLINRKNRKVVNSKKDTILIPEEIKSIRVFANSENEVIDTREVILSSFGQKVEIEGIYFSQAATSDGISSKDFTFWGKPNERIKEILKKNLDFILVPTLNLNPYLLYLLLHSKSNAKIGFYSPKNHEYLDLMLEEKGENLKESIQNLLDYYIKIKEAC